MNVATHRPDTTSFATQAQAQTAMRLLLIEDDLEAAGYLVKGLRENGYTIDHSADGRDGLERATSGEYDVIIADRQLPELDGLSIIVELRKKADRTPVLILSALGTVDDRVHGLKAGGDDYLTNAICRASPTMRRCSEELVHGQEYLEAAE